MRIKCSTKHMNVFQSLSSVSRIRILEILAEGPKNIGELAERLQVSSAITTRHVSMLEKAGIVCARNIPGKRGLQKICSLATNDIILTFCREEAPRNYHSVSIPIGQYTDYDTTPTCGLASVTNLIGLHDDPRYFSDPDHVKAALLWFGTGWVEYKIPSYIVSSQPIVAIEISLEICSEFPVYNENWPSDIHFYLNDVLLGVWTCPGDYGTPHGIYTPDWWRNGTQYGLLKTIRLTRQVCMIDGIRLSHVTLDQVPIEFGKDLRLKIAVPPDTRHPGGVNLLGKGFGNYDQDIEVTVEYE
jgi:predicted transcriptional regulator